MLGPDGQPLARKYYAEKTGKDLDADEVVRGYEVGKDKYVIVTDEELERLAPEKTRDIDLKQFVPADSIPPIYFERGYFLTPAAGSQKAYKLLAETMEKSGFAGIATFVMRGKEYLVAIFSDKGILRAETMRFADELRSPSDIGLPKKKNAPKASVQEFERLIKKHSSDELSTREMKDMAADRLVKLAEKKLKRGKDVVEMPESQTDEGKVVDIMDVLKKSMAAAKR